MSLGQSLQQKQLQRLSPQQIQLMKLLQIPSAQIEQRVKEELEENPALEMNLDLLDGDASTASEEMKDDLLQGLPDEEEAVPVDEYEMSNEELISLLKSLMNLYLANFFLRLVYNHKKVYLKFFYFYHLHFLLNYYMYIVIHYNLDHN